MDGRKLHQNELHVWSLDLDSGAIHKLSGYLNSLSPEEQRRAGTFVFAADRRRFAYARALLRAVLSSYTDIAPDAWCFSTTPFGRPEIDRPALRPTLRFNLSHTNSVVALGVVWDCDIGVDVESFDRQLPRDIAARFFTVFERDDLDSQAAADQPRQFTKYWTLKEAFAKARGLGLSLPFEGFGFDLTNSDGKALLRLSDLPFDESRQWQFTTAPIRNDHQLAVAVRSGRRGPLDVAIHSV